MTNGDIANKLLSVFKEYGDILSVKASRDSKDRPFGFVEFKDVSSAIKAMENVSDMIMGNRKVRVEFAKQQMKLGIRKECDGDSDNSFKEEMQFFQHQILKTINRKDVVFNIYYDSSQSSPILSAIVKFENISKASKTYDEWIEKKEWQIVWLNTNVSNKSTQIRNSGLVQIVPIIREQKTFLNGINPAFKSKFKHCESLKLGNDLNECYSLMDKNILFVGRLNGKMVTCQILVEYFGVWGNIIEIKLYNRNVIGIDGVVLDAYALILYEKIEFKEKAIMNGDGNVWLGQSIRCDNGKNGAINDFM